MATYTTNLNLEKPATSENFNLSKINSNWDKIDAGWGTLSDRVTSKQIASSSASSHTFTVANNSRHFIVITGATNARCWVGLVVCSGDGSVTYAEIYKASSSIFSSINVSVSNKITFALSGSYALYVSDFYVGTALS